MTRIQKLTRVEQIANLICTDWKLIFQFFNGSLRGIRQRQALRLPLPRVPLPPGRRPLPRQLLHRLRGEPGGEQGLRSHHFRYRYPRHTRVGDRKWLSTLFHNRWYDSAFYSIRFRIRNCQKVERSIPDPDPES